MYLSRFNALMPELQKRLFALYGSRWDFYLLLQRLVNLMEQTVASRNPALLARDAAAEARGAENPHGSETGIMLYVDLFSGSLAALEEKIPYLQQLGITYVHLMPLFRSPEGDNDGGYAVSSYREVNPALGTITDLARIAERFHDAGMRLVLDFVFNHTSDEHEWALAAKRGEEKYKDYYRIFPDKTEAEEWNRTLREIFPDTRRGSFTFVEAVQGWVWTTFNSFQWDLNYANPEVFLSMCSEMLALSNLGVDVLRLDALAFVWKEKGTNCENLPLAHSLIQAFRYVSMIAAPSLEFKSEAIVHPDEVIRYIAVNECTLSYNPLQMALFWEAVATRKTTLLGYSLRKRWSTPPSCSWVNYIRCHDDIGWTFSDEDARDCGINGFHHRQFLNKFYTGRFEGSFARGEPFQLNPETGDCRVCGTMASLAGLEQALEVYSAGLEANDPAQLNHAELLASMAVRRIGMMCTVLISLPGIPLLYANDEIGVLNDYRYRSDPAKKDDSRWVHRIVSDWERIETFVSGFERKRGHSHAVVVNDDNRTGTCVAVDEWLSAKQFEIYSRLKRSLSVRAADSRMSGFGVHFLSLTDQRILAFERFSGDKSSRKDRLRIWANFSDQAVALPLPERTSGTDVLTGTQLEGAEVLVLEPYRVIWLSED